jgi:CO/xanthine dehydrogenase Mo-binding subunit
MGPACALVQIKDGQVTCWSGTQKSHFVQEGLALTLDLPVDKVRVIHITGPGSYGRNDADDCAMDAAVLAKAVGKPVRLQYMREQGTGWDPKVPLQFTGLAPRSTQRARSRPMNSRARASRGSTSIPTAASRTIPWLDKRAVLR